MTPDEFWEHEFGRCQSANDFSGRLIRKNEYGVRSEHGWTLDHILPLALNGPDKEDNKQITHWRTNEEKADDNPFIINNKKYQIKKVRNLYKEDKIAPYPYKRNGKKYCIIIIEENI
jgi:CRISPR/Cas system Type II protein with McrA/HNH and RuvC-like nuclease domain